MASGGAGTAQLVHCARSPITDQQQSVQSASGCAAQSTLRHHPVARADAPAISRIMGRLRFLAQLVKNTKSVAVAALRAAAAR